MAIISMYNPYTSINIMRMATIKLVALGIHCSGAACPGEASYLSWASETHHWFAPAIEIIASIFQEDPLLPTGPRLV
jgi:hypothetical protein